jgi:hypothetical protein
MPIKNSIFILAVALTGILALLTACSLPSQENTPVPQPYTTEPQPTQLLGGDRDEHGCIGSAGYSWCEVKNKCLRVWEEECISQVKVEVYPPGTTTEEIVPPFTEKTKSEIPPLRENQPAPADTIVDESAIKTALAAAHGKTSDDLTVKNAQITGNFARGGVSYAPGGEGPSGLFLAFKKDGAWEIVFEGNGSVDCNTVEQYGFPSAMLEGVCY